MANWRPAPLAVDPAEIEAERGRGWVNFHPEDYCHRCGCPNVRSWSVASELWNVVDEENGRVSILCPQCFTSQYEERTGSRVTWRLTIDPETTPSVPTEQVAALVDLLYPDDMTPAAKRMFDNLTNPEF